MKKLWAILLFFTQIGFIVFTYLINLKLGVRYLRIVKTSRVVFCESDGWIG
jgi:hypothetical protein